MRRASVVFVMLGTLAIWSGSAGAQSFATQSSTAPSSNTTVQPPPLARYCDQSVSAAVETKLAACTAMIDSGKYSGLDLADIYLMRARIHFFLNNDRSLALADFERTLKLNPRYAAVFYYRSFVYSAENDFDRAITDLTEAIKINPDEAELYTQRAHVYMSKHDYDRAVADLNTAVKLDPEDPYPLFLRGNSQTLSGQMNSGYKELHRLLESLSQERK